ncbi:molybdate ABC transporter substrate-binding protein [Vibrio sp. 1-Bac 57]
MLKRLNKRFLCFAILLVSSLMAANVIAATVAVKEVKPVTSVNNQNTPENIKALNLEPLNIAVASNFKVAALDIARQFTKQFAIEVHISSASTATLYQQIIRGAPFDLFLSADQKHVKLLIDANKTAQHLGFIYAQGRLVFWQPALNHQPTLDDFMTYQDRLAIANPKFAPYGIAAQQALTFTEKWQSQPYVMGNNINQAFQFVDSKSVAAGLVSYAAVIQKQQTHYVLIPLQWHQPITQYGVIINDQKSQQAELFKQFLLSSTIQKQIAQQGYN